MSSRYSSDIQIGGQVTVLTHSGSWLLDRPGVYTIRCTCGWAHTEGTRYQRGNQAEALARFRLHEKGVAA